MLGYGELLMKYRAIHCAAIINPGMLYAGIGRLIDFKTAGRGHYTDAQLLFFWAMKGSDSIGDWNLSVRPSA